MDVVSIEVFSKVYCLQKTRRISDFFPQFVESTDTRVSYRFRGVVSPMIERLDVCLSVKLSLLTS